MGAAHELAVAGFPFVGDIVDSGGSARIGANAGGSGYPDRYRYPNRRVHPNSHETIICSGPSTLMPWPMRSNIS
jgi:hypothetical protein